RKPLTPLDSGCFGYILEADGRVGHSDSDGCEALHSPELRAVFCRRARDVETALPAFASAVGALRQRALSGGDSIFVLIRGSDSPPGRREPVPVASDRFPRARRSRIRPRLSLLRLSAEP